MLVVAEHDGRRLAESTAKCVACARELAPAVARRRGIRGTPRPRGPSGQAARLAGVTKVLRVERPANAAPLAAVLAPQIAQLAADYSHVLGPSTTFGKDVMPRAAALLGVGQVSDVMAVEGAYRFQRPIYAGNAIVTVEAAPERKLVGYRPDGVLSARRRPSANRRRRSKREPARAELPTHTRFVRLEAQRSRSPGAADRGAGRLGRPRLRQRGEVRPALRARRRARRRRRRLAGRRRRGLRLERSAGRADGQGHRAAALRCGRHLGRHPALDGYQGRAGHRRDQQGPRGADLRGRGHRLGGGSVRRRAAVDRGAEGVGGGGVDGLLCSRRVPSQARSRGAPSQAWGREGAMGSVGRFAGPP